MIYKPKFITLKEVVPRETFEKYGESAWRFMSPSIIYALDKVREYFEAPIEINTWAYGGSMQYRGYRPPSCEIGAPESGHRRGMCADFVISGWECSKVRDVIKTKYENYFKDAGITAIEEGTDTWVHISCENFMNEDLTLIPFWLPKEKD